MKPQLKPELKTVKSTGRSKSRRIDPKSILNPWLFINLSGEMIYILCQRLQAQQISAEKSRRVLRDLCDALLNLEPQIFKRRPLDSWEDTCTLLEKITHCSIMRLNRDSLSKLLDLMVQTVKMQLVRMSQPRDMIDCTLNHLYGISDCLNGTNYLTSMLKPVNNEESSLFDATEPSEYPSTFSFGNIRGLKTTGLTRATEKSSDMTQKTNGMQNENSLPENVLRHAKESSGLHYDQQQMDLTHSIVIRWSNKIERLYGRASLMDPHTLYRMRRLLLNFLRDRKVKVSLLLHYRLQCHNGFVIRNNIIDQSEDTKKTSSLPIIQHFHPLKESKKLVFGSSSSVSNAAVAKTSSFAGSDDLFEESNSGIQGNSDSVSDRSGKSSIQDSSSGSERKLMVSCSKSPSSTLRTTLGLNLYQSYSESQKLEQERISKQGNIDANQPAAERPEEGLEGTSEGHSGKNTSSVKQARQQKFHNELGLLEDLLIGGEKGMRDQRKKNRDSIMFDLEFLDEEEQSRFDHRHQTTTITPLSGTTAKNEATEDGNGGKINESEKKVIKKKTGDLKAEALSALRLDDTGLVTQHISDKYDYDDGGYEEEDGEQDSDEELLSMM